MKQKLIIRPEAEVDITSAVVWYEERERGLGNQLLSEIRSGINRALTAPDAYLKATLTTSSSPHSGKTVSLPHLLRHTTRCIHRSRGHTCSSAR
jgi:hypothetical protein